MARQTDGDRRLGDGISYALATTTGEPLLCKGDDFPLTDIARVI
jgi:uncharacterized protein with PIN domain